MPERYDQPPPPPPEEYGPPRRVPRMRSPMGPTQIPKWIGILVVVGVILMFVGMVLLNLTHPTEPPPELPKDADNNLDDYDSDEYQDWLEDYYEWEHDYENAERNDAQTFQTGVIIHNIGVLLAALPLLIAGLFLTNLDMGMRKVLIVVAIILLIVMYLVVGSWAYIYEIRP